MPNIVKKTTLVSLPDLLAPHSCRGCGRIGQAVCKYCKNYIIKNHQNICPFCHQPKTSGQCPCSPQLPSIFISGERKGLLGELIHEFKFNSIRTLAHPLAEVLDHTIPHIDGQVVIVPLPTIGRHIRERGFDHTMLIAKHLASLHTNYHVQNLILRSQNTIQVGSNRQDRLTQASHAYHLNSKINILPNTTYILLDDVWTTGASIQSAYALLKNTNASHITLALLAHS